MVADLRLTAATRSPVVEYPLVWMTGKNVKRRENNRIIIIILCVSKFLVLTSCDIPHIIPPLYYCFVLVCVLAAVSH
jgi:hypothetical protein